MEAERKDKIDDLDVVFRKVLIKDASGLFAKVSEGMMRLAVGRLDYLNAFSDKKDMDMLLDVICAYTDKIDAEGNRKPLMLLELNKRPEIIIPLITTFLQFNFHFFSQAQDVLSRISKSES